MQRKGWKMDAWGPVPPPFNPSFDPMAGERYKQVTQSMEADGFYDNHTREECKIEWRSRYDKLKEKDNDPQSTKSL